MPVVTKPDPFNAALLNSPALNVTIEQQNYIREILDIACSDSKFAQKAYDAIQHVLTAGVSKSPVINALNPSSATIGDPSFTLHVMGSNFTPTSEIIWNGSPEPTTFVSETEITTMVDMSTAEVAITFPVSVEDNGIRSDMVPFTLNTASSGVLSVKKSDFPVIKEKK